MGEKRGGASGVAKGPAPDSVPNTVGEDGAAAAERVAHRHVRAPKSRRPGGAVAVPAATTNPIEGNQGFPGSPLMEEEVAAGQSLQEAADAVLESPPVLQLKKQHQEALDGAYEAHARTQQQLSNRNNELSQLKKNHQQLQTTTDAWRKKAAAKEQVEKLNNDLNNDFEQLERDRASDKKRHLETLEQLKKEVSDVTSEFTDAHFRSQELESEKDALEGLNNQLHQRADALEGEIDSQRHLFADNARLEGQIAEVNALLEDAFSDMAEGLTLEQKFAFIREHQKKVAILARPRIFSGSSLHEELDTASNADSDHDEPKETLSFSVISAVETVPITPPAANSPVLLPTSTGDSDNHAFKETLSLSAINTVFDSAPVTPPAANPIVPLQAPTSASEHPMPKERLSFSAISTVDTAPVTPPAARPIVPLQAPTAASEYRAAKETLSSSAINAVDTAPIAPPTANPTKPLQAPTIALNYRAAKETLSFSATNAVNTRPIAGRKSKRPVLLQTPITDSDDDTPEETMSFTFTGVPSVEPGPSFAPTKPKPKVIYRPRNIYHDIIVDRPTTPWWMWLLFLIAIMTCAGAFAALVREKKIWTDANDLAYLRLMGLQQESWIEWIGSGVRDLLGVGDLLPGMGGGSAGFSLFS